MTPPPESCGVNRGILRQELGYSEAEEGVLTIARHYFNTFACPERHGWIAAIAAALQDFDDAHGPEVAVAVLAAVQAMRRTRYSTFRFNNPDCAVCARYVTPHERAFMASLRAVERGRTADAAAHAGLLCEGNDVRGFLSALDVLAARALPADGTQSHPSGTRSPAEVAGV
ncbi:MAG: hypothetical protein AAGB05_09155 [Pseudomonadota bacterium]